MKVTTALGTLVVVPAIICAAAGCSDKSRDSSPTAVTATGVPVGLAAERSSDNEGSSSNFKIFGNAHLTRDPENPANVVLQVNTDAAFNAAGAYRKLHNVQLWQLDHQLNFKYAFVAPHSCGGGSPRIILLIDANGDGRFDQAPNGPDFALNGHVNPPAFAGCPTSFPTANNGGPNPSTLLWRFEDLTDELTRWEITPGSVVPNIPGFPPYPGPNWDLLEQVISTAYPNHRVLEAIFLEDFNPTTPGTAYYDLITVLDLTLGTRGQVEPERGNRDD
ncbi:MAG: hypothetical protein M3Z54_05485 [Gemmatimonadota bacterium]|nr:hypothetical protein [Gemmatimonadota bacterium]